MDKLKFWQSLARNHRYKSECLKIILNNMSQEEWSEFWLKNHEDIHWYNTTKLKEATKNDK